MFYLAPREEWYYCVARLTAQFDDGKADVGTAFIIKCPPNYFIVTSRHTIDPSYRPPNEKRHASVVKIAVEYSAFAGTELATASHHFERVEILGPIFVHDKEENDCSVVCVPIETLTTSRHGLKHRPASFAFDMLADSQHLAVRYPGEPVVFFGYPRSSQKLDQPETLDFQPTLPILRQGVLSLPTKTGLAIDGYIGSNYGLLDSFAQKGFSGSPIVSLQRGYEGGVFGPPSEFRPPRLIGVVAGHVKSSDDRSDGVHSGISCFVRSTSIIQLVSSMMAIPVIQTEHP